MITPPTLPPAERFDRLVQGVAAAVAAQHKEGRLFGTLLLLTWSRLRRAGVRVLALAAAYAAGTFRSRPSRERPYRPRPKAPPEAAPAATPAAAEKPKLPSGFGWLLGRARVAFGRWQMADLLAQPDMQELIAAVPPIAHHLRPVCRMLGVKPPPGLFPPRRKPRRPPRETPAPEPPARPRLAATKAPPPKPQPPPPPGTPLFARPPQRFRRRRRPVSLLPLKTT